MAERRVLRMPFKKINAKQMIKDKIKIDKEFKESYDEIKTEYALVRKIAETRKEMGLTQQKLADKIGVKQQVISRFENERHTPNLSNFIKILNGLDLEISIDKKKEPIKH